MGLKLSNNATSTLAAGITNAATSLTVQSGDAGLFPSLAAGDWFPLTLVDGNGNMEIMLATARAGAVITVVRAQEGTTAKAFPAGSRVDLRVTAVAILGAPQAQIAAADEKTEPEDNDVVGLLDSAVNFIMKKLTWANILAALDPRYFSVAQGAALAATVDDKLDANANAVSATNADKVDNLHASSFVRSDADDTVSGHTEWQDSKEVRLGNSADMRMYHNGSHTYFDNYTGTLYFKQRVHAGDVYFQGEDSGGTNRNLLALIDGLYAQLYYQSSAKLRTDGSGVLVYGRLHADNNIYIGKNGGGDSWGYYYDDNSNTWRSLGWDDSRNAFCLEYNDGVFHKVAGVYDGSSSTYRDYPIGSIGTARTGTSLYAVNSSRTLRCRSGAACFHLSSGSTLDGTWRVCGQTTNYSDAKYQIFRRVA